MSRRLVRPAVLLALLVCLPSSFLVAGSREDLPEHLSTSTTRSFDLDTESSALASEVAILEYLRQAPVIASERLGEGINRPLKLTLERDGVRRHAIFRTVEQRVHGSPTGSVHRRFRDSYRFEVAAYRLARLLGLHNVPPTVLRSIDGVQGSLQLWVEGATSEARRRRKGLDRVRPARWFRDTQTMAAFDNLIYNFDRNAGNILYDRDGKVWMVDHTRSFKSVGMLDSPASIVAVDRTFLERLRGLDAELVRAELAPYLEPLAIQAILARRKKLLHFIDSLVAERGQGRVLFEAPSASG